jgi:hypothetical protein
MTNKSKHTHVRAVNTNEPDEHLEDKLAAMSVRLEQAMAMIEAVAIAVDTRHVDRARALSPESAAEVLDAAHELLSDGVQTPLLALLKGEIDAATVQS